MPKSKNSNWRLQIANFLGGVAYFFCLLGWFWSTILYLPTLKVLLEQFMSYYPRATSETKVPIQTGEPNELVALVGIIVTLVMIALTIYVLIKLPLTIAKAGKKITHEPAEMIAPLVAKHQHKKDTPKQRRIIAYRLTLIFKVVLVTFPVILTVFSQLIDQLLEISVSLAMSSALGTVAGTFFAVQMLVANAWKLDRKSLW
ncbi:MAG: hypothetical protein WBB94_03635 [Candidatus Saccharimonadaceae bacterium]